MPSLDTGTLNVTNLESNAVAVTTDKAGITLSGTFDRDEVQLLVQDEGGSNDFHPHKKHLFSEEGTYYFANPKASTTIQLQLVNGGRQNTSIFYEIAT